ncbi:MAG: hypothetical protein WBP61_00925 [Nocardioides sp.]
MTSPVTERFHATNGRVSGYIGLATTLGILVLAVLPWDAGRPLGVAILALLGSLVVWVVMLRPALGATERTLVMRGSFRTDEIPLGAIERVVVAQVLAVTARGVRYLTPVVGYTARQSLKAKRRSMIDRADGVRAAPASDRVATAQNDYQVYVEQRILQLAKEDGERFGPTDAAVRRTYAWPEIAGFVVLVAAFLVWWLVL